MFKAIWLEQRDKKTHAQVRYVSDAELPEGDTRVHVDYSTLNYKDALAITGRSPVVRKFPMIPGIDFAGTVETTSSPGLAAGDEVVLTGWGHGETTWGGLAHKAVVRGDRLVKLPSALSSRDAMVIGTAGLTAMLAVLALEKHGVQPSDGEVLVTGAGGGVGGFSVALLAKRGYSVVVSTGREVESSRLRRLGASGVMPRSALSESGKALQKERWAAAIDCVGSHTLANVCAATRYGGVVAACGLAQGMDFPASVAPFILRAVHLVGIDSVFAAQEVRAAAWRRLAQDLDRAVIDDMAHEIALEDVVSSAVQLLDGQVSGRLLVTLN